MLLPEGDNYLAIVMEEILVWPEIAEATCPYCGATFFAPKALNELFEHVKDKGYIDPEFPCCRFCLARFDTVQEVFQHWVDAHLVELIVPGVAVYGLPEQAMPGDTVTITHIFNLEKRSKSWCNVTVSIGLDHYREPYGCGLVLMQDTYIVSDVGRPECFPADVKPLDHTGQYSQTETVTIPETCLRPGGVEVPVPAGEYTVYSEGRNKRLDKWGLPGTCNRTVTGMGGWKKEVGKIWIGVF